MPLSSPIDHLFAAGACFAGRAGAFVERGWYYFQTIFMGTGRMSTGRFVLCGLLGTLATFWAASCQGPEEFFRENAISSGTGGAPGTGGTLTGSGGSGTGGADRDRRSAGDGRRDRNGRHRGDGRREGDGRYRGDGRRDRNGRHRGDGRRDGDGRHRGDRRRAGDRRTCNRRRDGNGRYRGDGRRAGDGRNRGGGTSGMAGSTGTAKNCVDAIKLAGYSAGRRSPAAPARKTAPTNRRTA